MSESRPAHLIWDAFAGGAPATVSAELPRLNFSGLNAYVTSAYIMSLGHGKQDRAYAAVINGRATGGRALLLVLSTDLRVLHMELAERTWHLRENPLFARSSATETGEYAVVAGRVTR